MERVIAGQPEPAPIASTARAQILISIGIIAWNEEKAIGATLASLLDQSLYEKLSARSLRCEIICLANGCTDRTSEIAANIFAARSTQSLFEKTVECRSIDIKERGKNNAWNRFVHEFSAPEARFLFLMDADILLQGRDTLWNMLDSLDNNPGATVATDRPCKSVAFKTRKTPFERLSLLASRFSRVADAQLCGQLYCIRSEIARRIYLPKDLSACEDGFIKALVCTDFLTRKMTPARIVVAKDASHTFEPYTSVRALLKNQKRQMIGQTIVHILVDDYLRTLPRSDRLNLAQALKKQELADPLWLKRMIDNHVQKTRYFWRLIPGIAAFRFKRLKRLPGVQRITGIPIATAGFLVSMVSCYLAFAFLRRGQIAYWPHAKS